MNLVTFKNLHGANLGQISFENDCYNEEIPGWEIRKQRLKNYGYDLTENVKLFEKCI